MIPNKRDTSSETMVLIVYPTIIHHENSSSRPSFPFLVLVSRLLQLNVM